MTTGQILEMCADAGLAVRDATLQKGVLLLTPASLTELPTAAELRELALKLRGDAVRWVTLNLEEPS